MDSENSTSSVACSALIVFFLNLLCIHLYIYMYINICI